MSITVDWLFEQTAMPDFFLLAGDASRQTAISGINIMDNPDTIPWLAPGTLVLSTGYFFNDPSFTEDLIEKLVQKQCAGLGIKMNRYLTALPDPVKEQADRFHFPVFNVPFSSSMDQIANLIYRRLFEEELSNAQKLTLFYKNVTEAAFRFKSISKLLSIIQEAALASIFLTDDSFEIIESSIMERDSQSQWSIPLTTGHFLFGIEEIRAIKESFDRTHMPRLMHTSVCHDQTHCFEIFPITNRSELLGFLVAVQEKNGLSAYNLIQNIESVLSIVMLQLSVQTQKEASSRDLFFQKLLSGKLTSEMEIELFCRQNGISFKRPRTCLVFHDASYEALSIAKRRAFERKFFALAVPALSENGCMVFHTVFQTSFVCFLLWNTNETAKDLLKKSISQAAHCCQFLSSQAFCLQVGVSEVLSGALTIRAGFDQAQSALQIGSLLHPDESCFSYEKDWIFQKLLHHFSQAELMDIYKQYLGVLEDYDTQNQSELLPTLESYLEHFLNTAQTAKALYIHRNTMIYRIGQIEELLGIDLADSDTIYRLQTAFYIKKLLCRFDHPCE